MSAKRHKLELNPLGIVREYNDEIGSSVIRMVDIDFLFDRMLKHIPVKYDEKTKTIEFLYLGKLYFVDYSDDLKNIIYNGNYNEYYEIYKEKMNIKINESVIMHYDYNNDIDELSKIALLHKALEEEYKNTSAKASDNFISLSLNSLTALACVLMPFFVYRLVGGRIHVTLATTAFLDLLIWAMCYSNEDISVIKDRISNISKYSKEKKVLKYKLEEVNNYIDDILKLKDLNNPKDELLYSINDVMKKIKRLPKTNRIYYVDIIKKIVKNYFNLCDELVYGEINLEHYNNIISRFLEAVDNIKKELNTNVQRKLKI